MFGFLTIFFIKQRPEILGFGCILFLLGLNIKTSTFNKNVIAKQ